MGTRVLAVALMLCYVIGTAQLMAVTKVGLRQGLVTGVLPFVPFDLAKITLSATLAGALGRARLSPTA